MKYNLVCCSGIFCCRISNNDFYRALFIVTFMSGACACSLLEKFRVHVLVIPAFFKVTESRCLSRNIYDVNNPMHSIHNQVPVFVVLHVTLELFFVDCALDCLHCTWEHNGMYTLKKYLGFVVYLFIFYPSGLLHLTLKILSVVLTLLLSDFWWFL